jgi:hypothetical protein
VDADPARETPERLEDLQEVFVRDAGLVYFRAGLAGEELGELDVEIDEVSCVLAPLELVLWSSP